ncbi:Phage terminase, large subunit [Caballeronia sordidicola]|uniref:Phage terminase, large subunit n=1 Tax=Caballeronia sordidicola TaxID=196367 RepID=A0A242MDM2_CABSO|nr:Phage terminase, large subunit [Caballeronia sordidicola]
MRWIERHCRVPTGPKENVGKHLKLAPFQRKWLLDIFDNPYGTRHGYLSVGRKSGKTLLAACVVALYLAGPEASRNAQIVSGANSRDQAGHIYKALSQMVALSPQLKKRIRCTEHSKIAKCSATGCVYMPLAADGRTAMGLSPVLVILDEIGQIAEADSAFVDSLTTSQLAFGAEALLLAVSTQAPLDSSLWSLWLDDAATNADPTVVSHLYAAPEDAELDDESALIAANPGIGYYTDLETLMKSAKAAKRGLNSNGFRNLHMNLRVDTSDPWMSVSVWNETFGELVDWDDCQYVTGGLDLSESIDLTAFVLSGVRPDGHWQVQSFAWKPAETLQAHADRDKRPYAEWVRDGKLRTTPGRTIDSDQVAKEVHEICRMANVKRAYYDPAYYGRFKRAWDELPDSYVDWEPLKQTIVHLTEPTKALRDSLVAGTCVHSPEDLVLTMCVLNAKAYEDINLNTRLIKKKAMGRIDAAAAAVNAVSGLVNFVPNRLYQIFAVDSNFKL